MVVAVRGSARAAVREAAEALVAVAREEAVWVEEEREEAASAPEVMEEAAGLCECLFTVWINMVKLGQLKENETFVNYTLSNINIDYIN